MWKERTLRQLFLEHARQYRADCIVFKYNCSLEVQDIGPLGRIPIDRCGIAAFHETEANAQIDRVPAAKKGGPLEGLTVSREKAIDSLLRSSRS